VDQCPLQVLEYAFPKTDVTFGTLGMGASVAQRQLHAANSSDHAPTADTIMLLRLEYSPPDGSRRMVVLAWTVRVMAGLDL
jgi:hypothetical protein